MNRINRNGLCEERRKLCFHCQALNKCSFVFDMAFRRVSISFLFRLQLSCAIQKRNQQDPCYLSSCQRPSVRPLPGPSGLIITKCPQFTSTTAPLNSHTNRTPARNTSSAPSSSPSAAPTTPSSKVPPGRGRRWGCCAEAWLGGWRRWQRGSGKC